MVVLKVYFISLPLPVIIQIIMGALTIIVFFYGTGVIVRKLVERKADLAKQQEDALERQRVLKAISDIETDIEDLRKDGDKKENYIKDIEKQLQKIKLLMASHLKINVEDH